MTKEELNELIKELRTVSKSMEDSIVMSLQLEGENVSDTWKGRAFELLLASYQEMAMMIIEESMEEALEEDLTKMPSVILKGDGEIN